MFGKKKRYVIHSGRGDGHGNAKVKREVDKYYKWKAKHPKDYSKKERYEVG